MKVAKQAVQCYCAVTGNPWTSFYDKLDEALASNAESGELWLIKRLMDTVQANGMSVAEFKMNKDAVKGVFDDEGRRKAGEFFTPELWAAEARKYFDKHIPNWHDMNVWDGSCYSMDTQLYVKRKNGTEGWITFDKLSADDKVWSLDPETGKQRWTGIVRTMTTESNTAYEFGVPAVRMATDPLFSDIADYDTFTQMGRDCELYDYTAEDYAKWGLPTPTQVFGDCMYFETNDGREVRVDFEEDYGDYLRRNFLSCGVEYALKVTGDHAMWVRDVLECDDDWLREVHDGNLPEELKTGYTRIEDTSNLYMSKKLIKVTAKELYQWHKECRSFIIEGYSCTSAGQTDDNRRAAWLFPVEWTWDVDDYYSEDMEQLYLSDYAKGTADVTEEVVMDYFLNHDEMDWCREIVSDTAEKFWDITLERDHVFLVRRGSNGIPLFCGNCGSGNLMRTAGHPANKLFLSSLQSEDIVLVKGTPAYADATVFQCDFLKDLDYDTVNTEFLNKLPERLQQIIRNDEPLIIYMNPPYKSVVTRETDVGNHMCEIGLGAAAYDLFYQFMWRVSHFVDLFNLKNTWVGVFGPLQWFSAYGGRTMLEEFEHCFKFVDGMCLAATEFSDTSTTISWGIGFSLWQSKGGYFKDSENNDIILEKRIKLPDGTVGVEGKVLYDAPRDNLGDWTVPKDVMFYEQAPVLTSHSTFKGSSAGEKVAHSSGKIAVNSFGIMMSTNDNLTRGNHHSAVLSAPTTMTYVSITEENFWRCVASFAFRNVYTASWSISKKYGSAPKETTEGYKEWLYNALVCFLFEYKSMPSSIRGVSWEGTTVDVDNKLFYLSAEDVKANCTDPVVLADLEAHPPANQFILDRIEEAKPYWSEECRAVYDWVVNYTLFSYSRREAINHAGNMECWNAGLQQIRAAIWDDTMQETFTELLQKMRDYLVKDVERFGFIREFADE